MVTYLNGMFRGLKKWKECLLDALSQKLINLLHSKKVQDKLRFLIIKELLIGNNLKLMLIVLSSKTEKESKFLMLVIPIVTNGLQCCFMK